jgi:hypothetical protein
MVYPPESREEIMRTIWTTLILCLPGCKIENSIIRDKGTDTFYQVEVDEVDILFVVDNSASMQEEQAALASGFESFVSELELANANFHIGVISTSQDTTDPERGYLLGDTPYLTAEDDYLTEFRKRVELGTNGSDKEKGLQAAAYALSPEMLVTYNGSFLRPEANLLVIIVSDEEDCSDDGKLDALDSAACYEQPELLTPVQTLVARIFDSKYNGEFVQIAAIVGPYDQSCADSYPGHRYADAALLTGGLLSKICDPDWSTVMYDLGLNAVGILDTFKLSSLADVTTLEVTVDQDGEGPTPPAPVLPDLANGWSYDWQYGTLKFNGLSVPPRGATIVVTYEIVPGDIPGPVQ